MAMDAATMAGQIGFAQAFFQQDSELQNLLNQAVGGQWDATRFQSAFMNTNWYRTKEASYRQWLDLSTRDPVEAQAKLFDRVNEFKDRATQLGWAYNPDWLRTLAEWSIAWSWSDKQTTDIFAEETLKAGGFTPGQMGGTPAMVEMQLKKMAGDYGLTLTDNQTRDWAYGVVNESYTQDNIKDFMRDQAKSRYVGMSSQLDQGFTVRQVASEYVNSYARLLETDPDTVNLNDNIIQQALQGAPQAPGQPPVMQSVYQFERAVRRDPRWLRTKNARDDLVTAGQSLLKDWGLVA